jgi:hypothetical protein
MNETQILFHRRGTYAGERKRNTTVLKYKECFLYPTCNWLLICEMGGSLFMICSFYPTFIIMVYPFSSGFY